MTEERAGDQPGRRRGDDADHGQLSQEDLAQLRRLAPDLSEDLIRHILTSDDG